MACPNSARPTDLPYGAAQSGVVTAHGVEIMARLPGPPADPAIRHAGWRGRKPAIR
jgi:hypothetical protein